MVRSSMRAAVASEMRSPLVSSRVISASERGPSARAAARSWRRSVVLSRVVAWSSSGRGGSTSGKGGPTPGGGGGGGGADHGVLAGGVAVEAVQRGGAAGDAGRGQPAAAAGVAGFGEQPEVGVGVVDAGGERVEVEAGAEGEPGGEVGGVGGAGLGRALREQEAAHQILEGAEPLRLDRCPVGSSELAGCGGGHKVGHGPGR